MKTLQSFLKAPQQKPIVWTLVTFILSLTVLAAVFHVLDKRTVEHQEQLFNKQQYRQTYLAARGLTQVFDMYTNKFPHLLKKPIAQLSDKKVDFPTFGNNVKNIAMACPEMVFGVLYQSTDPGRAIFSSVPGQEHWYADFSRHSVSGKRMPTPFTKGYRCWIDFFASPTRQLAHITVDFSPVAGHRTLLGLIVDMAPIVARYIDPIRSGKYGAAYLLSSDGTVLFDHESAIIGRNVFDSLHAGHGDLQRIDRRMVRENHGTGTYTFSVARGETVRRKLVAWTAAPLLPTREKFIVAISAPDNEVNKHLNTLWPQRYMLAGIVTLLAVTLAVIINQILSNRRVEAARRQLDQIIDFLPDATFVLDASHRVIAWNKAMEKLTSVPKSTIIGKKGSSVPDLAPYTPFLAECLDLEESELARSYPSLQRNDQGINAEEYIPESYGGRGSFVWFTATRLLDEQTKVPATIQCIRDISAFKKTELALKQSQERFSLAVEANSTGIWDWDRRTDKVYFSNRWKRMLGYAPEEFPDTIGAWKEIIHPGDHAPVMAANNNLSPDNPCFEIEYRMRCKDGTYKWIQGRGTGRWDEQGNIYRMAGSHIDISERKMNELVLEALLRISTMANRVRDTKYLFREIHQTLKELLGADNFFIALWNPDNHMITFPYFVDEYDSGRCYDHIETDLNEDQPGLTNWVLRNEKPLFLTRESPLLDRRKGPKPVAWLGVPIIIGSQTRGVLCVQDYHDVNRFREKDLDVLFAIAEQTALALDRKQGEDQMAFYAMHDPLTDLPNRALFSDRLDRCLKRARRHQSYNFAVMMIDLDRFKTINDSMGHPTGDHLLVELAKRIGPLLRGEDTIARLGGDEFAILIEDFHTPREIISVAKRILVAITQPFKIEAKTVHTNASIGIVINTAEYSQAENIIRDADIAMYEAKKNAPGRFRVFNKQMHNQAVETMSLENDLRRAIEQQEIQVAYQPIYSIDPLGINGFEALARWDHPDKGPIGPDIFIPIAEETGLMHPLGLHVLETACATLSQWRGSSDPDLVMAVNLSARQLTHPYLVDRIQETLERHGLPGGALEIEITESTFMEHPRTSHVVLNRLKTLGIYLAVDDFGTGYSSLSYLQKLPVDTLKVDRSFIKDLDTNPKSRVIARAILALAHSLDKEVVAEGVETKNQLEWLGNLGCEKVQGFYLSKPLFREEADLLLRRTKEG
ncbi:EAL domain-containing protein [Desulfoplanes sp.]